MDARELDPIRLIESPMSAQPQPRKVRVSIEQFGSVADNFIYKPEPRIKALRPFQVRAANHMTMWAATINGMATGLGKTCSTIATIDTLDLFPAVIVCGSRVALQWAGEFIHWLKLHAPLRPDLTVSLLEGESPRPFENRYIKTLAGDTTISVPLNDLSADVLIGTYSIVYDWAAAIAARGNRVLVCDEVHRLSNLRPRTRGAGYPVIGTRQAVACWYLARHVVPTYYFQHIYGLSADAVVNRPKDLTGILEILGVMWRLGGWDYFRERYCGREGKVIFGKDGHLRRYWDDNGTSNLEELHHRLTVLGLLFRVTKKEALPDMPANTEITIPVTLSNQEEYDRAEAGLLSYIREMALIDRELNERLEAMNLEQLIIECEDLRSKHPRALGPLPENPDAPALRAHLLQATAHSKQYQAAKAQALVRLTTLRRLVGEGKVEVAIEWLRDFADENPQEKVILFSHHRPVQDALFRAFPGAARITGGQTPAQSDENKHRLQRDPNCTTCLISNEAGGEGLNCSASRHTGILEWPWHRKGINQQIGRSNGRMDNPHEVNVYYFHAAGTIDDDVRRIVYQKGRMSSIILDGKEPDDESLSRDINEELLAALVEKQR